MNLNRKAASLAITLMAVVSCSSVGQNSDNNNSLNSSNANINKENKKDSKAKVTSFFRLTKSFLYLASTITPIHLPEVFLENSS